MSDRLDTTVIVHRLKEADGFRTDAEVAHALGVDPRNLSNWKSRGVIPPEHLMAYCRRRQISLEWLINGNGPMRLKDMAMEPGAVYRVFTDQDVVYEIAALVYQALGEAGCTMSPDKFANIVKLLHRDVIEHGERTVPYEKVHQLVRLAA